MRYSACSLEKEEERRCLEARKEKVTPVPHARVAAFSRVAPWQDLVDGTGRGRLSKEGKRV